MNNQAKNIHLSALVKVMVSILSLIKNIKKQDQPPDNTGEATKQITLFTINKQSLPGLVQHPDNGSATRHLFLFVMYFSNYIFINFLAVIIVKL